MRDWIRTHSPGEAVLAGWALGSFIVLAGVIIAIVAGILGA